MRIETETLADKQKVLIVAKKDYPFITLFREELKKYGAEVFFSSQKPNSLKKFDYCFIISGKYSIEVHHNRINYNNVKIINLEGDIISKEIIDKVLWFAFSESKEKILTLRLGRQKKQKPTVALFGFQKKFNPKKLILLFIFLFIFLNLSFIFPLTVSTFYSYRSIATFKKGNATKTSNLLNSAEFYLKLGKNLYSFSRPTFLFLSIAIIPDNIFDIGSRSIIALRTSISILENAQTLSKMITEKDQTPEKKEFISFRINKLTEQLDLLEKNLSVLNQELPSKSKILKSTRNELSQILELVSKAKQISAHLDSFLGRNQEKNYLLLFANDMELRPGGGFIGSFGILKFKDLGLKELKIYDVYDADGQLKGHVDPPPPIRDYLNQPHWFLRDSAFSPDFLENYSQAKYFLEKELNLTDFSGSILLTTSSVKNILSAFGNIMLTDYNEIVNDQNFYLKAQLYAEKDFFPGSTQKKSFLGSLAKNILLNLENASIRQLATAIKKSLDEKKMAIYSDDLEIQKILNSFYWSGRLIEPKCPVSLNNCLNDFVFPVDANLGVNKANFFINRFINLRIFLSNPNIIKHYLSIQFKNDSPSEVFPGGNYKNYFQLYLPRDTIIKSITKDGTLVENFDEKISGEFKIIGFLTEVKVKKSVEIKINYDLERQINKNRNIYQLIFQKQLGSSNSDLTLEFNYDKNIKLINQNFSPLVKNNEILYNTNLSADKIFILEFNNN